jgi:hypothetical protein
MSAEDLERFTIYLSRRVSQQALEAALLQAARKTGVAMESLVLPIPPPPNRPLAPVYTLNGKPSKFKTEKQRRYVLWAIRTGAIRVPYRRTNSLYRSLTSKAELAGGSVYITVGSNKSYAPYVIGFPRQAGLVYPRGSNQQSFYHRQTGHKSLPEQISRQLPSLMRVFLSELQNNLSTP